MLFDPSSLSERLKLSPLRILGCMSGTSLDGIDLALLETDGENHIARGQTLYHQYRDSERDAIRLAFTARVKTSDVTKAEGIVTRNHVVAIEQWIKQFGENFDAIAFHGQTITHIPDEQFTWQIGKADVLSAKFERAVIYDFRSHDVEMGGQGAPLLPVYHRALVRSSGITGPVAIINIGGVSNITFIDGDELIAFDCGAGNALMNDVMTTHFAKDFDQDGALARTGTVDPSALEHLLSAKFFEQSYPKSLDRNPWDLSVVKQLSPLDQLATLHKFTVEGIARGIALLPSRPQSIYVTGGGRHNQFLMEEIARQTGIQTESVDRLGWNGDFMEAEGFAYMGARHLRGLPISFPHTTGAPHPLTGGQIAFTPAKNGVLSASL